MIRGRAVVTTMVASFTSRGVIALQFVRRLSGTAVTPVGEPGLRRGASADRLMPLSSIVAVRPMCGTARHGQPDRPVQLTRSKGSPTLSATAATGRTRFAPSSSGPRIGQLDALRGFALGGILLVNIGPAMHMRGIVEMQKLPIPHVLDLTAQQRFFALFSLLFGTGFGIFLQRAQGRAQRPRLLLARRLVALGVIGAAHTWLQPGEALLPYAVVGLVVLLPLSWAPRWVNLAVGLTSTVVPATLFGGGMVVVPGLLVTGFALARFGLPNALDRLGPHLLVAFVLAVAGSVPALLWQEQDPLNAGFTASSGVAGLTMALAYAAGLLLVLRTPVGPWIAPTLEALGRMALTNYVTATLLMRSVGPLLGLEGSTAWGTMLGFAAAILVVQALSSRWWPARFRYGPLEWVWRCVTWRQRVDLRRVDISPRHSISHRAGARSAPKTRPAR